MNAVILDSEDQDSVYTLLTSLCKKALEKNEPLPASSKYTRREAHLKKLRSQCFGILLGKSHENDGLKSNTENDMSPLAQLVAYSYNLHASGEKRLGCQLDNHIDKILSCNLFEDSTLMAVIHVLTLLKDSGSGRDDLLSQDPFDLSRIYPPIDEVMKNSSSPGPMPYPTPSPSLFTPPHWMNCHQSLLQERGYSAQYPFTNKPGEGLQYLSKFAVLFQKDRLNPRPSYSLRPIEMLTGPRSLSFSSPSPSVIIQEDEGYFTPDLDKAQERTRSDIHSSITDPTEIWSQALKIKEPRFQNWDFRGFPVAEPELPSFSAAPPIAALKVWQVSKLDQNIFAETKGEEVVWVTADRNPTSRRLFVQHAIYLLQGIESHSFLYKQETDSFIVRPGMWIEGLTPDSVAGLSEDLLSCGTHFRRLERMTHCRGFNSDEGTILQALRRSLRRFVLSYRATVLNISAELSNSDGPVLLFGLIRKIQTLKQQVECLNRLYRLTPGETALPSGIELLPHIYQELCRSMRRAQTCVLYSALTSCCEVYYRRLERWIFMGNCFDDDREEFFIRPDIQFASKRNRLFWTKSFVLNESLVPDFLRGLETTIFQCGRTVNLLRLCNPGNPLCVLLEKEHPVIRCSLQMSDLEVVQRECSKFEAEVRRVCGDFVTVAGILQEGRENERRIQQLIQKSNEERAVAQAAKAAEIARQRAAAKQAQLKELKEQMFAAEQRHQAMIEREKEEEARFLEETRKIEEMAEMARQEERAKLLKYYEALNEHIMRREQRVEWRLKRLQLSGSREKFFADESDRLKEALMNPPEIRSDCSVPDSQTSAKLNEPTIEIPTEKLIDISDISSDTQIEPEIPSTNEVSEQIRRKVLKEEFDIDVESRSESKSETEITAEITDANVEEVQIDEYYLCWEASREAALQAVINKRKIMESEFGIIPASQIDIEPSTMSVKSQGNESQLQDAPVAADEAEKNRIAMMRSTCVGPDTNPAEVTDTNVGEARMDEYYVCLDAAKEATLQAGINKRKMMESEFGIIPVSQSDQESSSVSVKSQKSESQLQDAPVAADEAEKNRIAMMRSTCVGTDTNPAEVKDTNVGEARIDEYYVCLDAANQATLQAGINKRKMMESEFGIIPVSQIDQESSSVSVKSQKSESQLQDAPVATDEAEKNRIAMMRSTCVGTDRNPAEVKDTNVGEARIDEYYVCLDAANQATLQAGINKRKMMESEFGIIPVSQIDQESSSVSVKSQKSESQLQDAHVATDEAEKNRIAMMRSTCVGTDTSPAVGKPVDENKEMSDLEKNRRRVLQEEFQVGDKSPSKSNVSFKGSLSGSELPSMSERMRNKLRVMGEEFDILTGAPRKNVQGRHVRISAEPDPTASDTRIEVRESSEVAEDVAELDEISEVIESKEEQRTEIVSSDSGFVSSATTVAERPKVLQLTSNVDSIESNKMTASTEDQLSGTSSGKRYEFSRAYSIDSSLFKRTPSTPFSMTTSFGTSVNIDGAPLMVDILDRFVGPTPPPAAAAQTPTPSEASGLADVSPSSVWLGTSLQQGLLIPLRTHHSLVSSALLQFFLRDLNLLSHLRSLRSYFFLLDGEFGRRLTSQVFTQMYQVTTPAGLLNGLTLNNLLAAALSQSYSGGDPNCSLLSFSVSTVPQHFSHSSPGALDCLHLHYRASWPINLILTDEALDKYNLIFIFLIRLRRVSWLLQEDFIVLKSTARQCNSQQRRDLLNSPEYHQVQIIRHCMSQFVQATQSYVTSAVLQASWTYLEQALQQARTLDHIYNAHIAYIKHVLRRCLLNQNSKRVEAVLNKVLSCVLQFHSLVRVRAWQAPSTITPGQRVYLQHPNFSKMVVCFKMFKLHVCKLVCYLEKLVAHPHQQTHLAEFLLLINLKDFYPASEYLKQVAESTASAGDYI